MADYYPLIARAVAGLILNKEEKRHELYARARAALVGRLSTLNPPLDEISRTKERLALEEAFYQVEATIVTAAEHGLSFSEFDHHGRIVDALGGLADSLHQQSFGARMELTPAGVLRFVSTASPADQAIAADLVIARMHSDMRSRCAALNDRSTRLLREARWAGLVRAVENLASLLEPPVAETAGRIGSIWILTLCLRAYIERSEDARWNATGMDDPSDAEVMRAVKDFVYVAGPWVRRFPSGRTLDNDVGTWANSQGDVEPAAMVLGRAERAGLLSGGDAEIVSIALDAGRADSVPAVRARCWAGGTIGNISVVLVQALVDLAKRRIGAPGSGFTGSAETAQAIENVVLNGRDELVKSLSPLAHGIEVDAVRGAFARLAPAFASG